MQNHPSWVRWLPGLLTVREYQAKWLANDIAAGIVLATMLVPVGIAYATASGVLGVYERALFLQFPRRTGLARRARKASPSASK